MSDIRFNRYIFIIMAIALIASAGKLHAAETKTFQVKAKKYEFIPGRRVYHQMHKILWMGAFFYDGQVDCFVTCKSKPDAESTSR